MSIESIASALPAIKHTAADLAAQTGAEESFIIKKVGISTRYVLGPEETGVSLATTACEKLLTKTGLDKNDIDLVVFVTQNPDRKLPQNSAQLAAALGLPATAAAFDLSLGCSGYVYALSVAESFLAGMGLETGLIVTCDPYSRIMLAEDRATNAVFGDAATATLVRRSGTRSVIGKFDFGTRGEDGDAIRVDRGGASNPMVGFDDSVVREYTADDLRLRMIGKDVYNFVLSTIPGSIENCLKVNERSPEDISWYALHQGSKFMLQGLAKRASIGPDKLLLNIDRYGNTVSSTIPLLLEDLMNEDKLADTTVLLSGFGVGLSWATTIVDFHH